MTAPEVPFASSVCHGCKFLRLVGTRRGSMFLQCTEGSLPRYGPQPVLRCPARQPAEVTPEPSKR